MADKLKEYWLFVFVVGCEEQNSKQCWTGQDTDLRTILYNIWDKAKVGEE